MKTKEFVKAIEGMGLYVGETPDHLKVTEDDDGMLCMACVHRKEVGVLETRSPRVNGLDRLVNKKIG